MDKTLIVVISMVFGLAMLMAVTQMTQAAAPVLEYTCPICGEKYATYEELYTHFTTEHPAQPIDIIWE